MTIEERLEKAEKLVAEVKAELAAMRAEKAAKRDWPDRIEAGDCFEAPTRNVFMQGRGDMLNLICVIGPALGCTVYYTCDDWKYLGRDILTIRTDAHEPTGAELVGRRVNCFDTLDQLQFEGVCDEYDPDATYPYRIGKARYFKARLAK